MVEIKNPAMLLAPLGKKRKTILFKMLLSILPETGYGNTRLIPTNLKNASDKGFKKPVNQEDEKSVSPRTVDRKFFSVHLDYLRVRGKCSIELFQELMVYLCGERWTVEMDKPWTPGFNAIYFQNRLIGMSGVCGGFTYQEDDHIVEYMIDLPGSYWEGVDVVGQWRLMRGLMHRYAVHCSRIDIAIDDESYEHIPVNEMVKAWEEGYAFSFRKYSFSGSGISPEDISITRYFGSRDSGKMVRVYDHNQECMRFEAEFKRDYAPQIFNALASLERGNTLDDACIDSDVIKDGKIPINILTSEVDNDHWSEILQQIMAAIALGAIDFRYKSGRADKSKGGRKDTKRVEFYQEFIDMIGHSLRVKLPKVVSTVEKSVRFLKRQVATTIAMMREGLGAINFAAVLKELQSNGQERMKSRHDFLVKEIKLHTQEVMGMFKTA